MDIEVQWHIFIIDFDTIDVYIRSVLVFPLEQIANFDRFDPRDLYI